MSSISFRSSFTSLQKQPNPTLSTMPSKSNFSQTNALKSFKRFTYQALNQKENSLQSQNVIQSTEEEDELNKCNVSSEEEEKNSNECIDNPLLKMEKYSKELIIKKNLTLEDNTLQFDQLISHYYFNNNSNKEKNNLNAVHHIKDILVEISHKQRNIDNYKREIKELQEKLNTKNRNNQNVSNSNNNKACMFFAEKNNTYNPSSNAFSTFAPSIVRTRTTASGTTASSNKIQVQNRYIKFKELVSKIKTQIIEQKKKEINTTLLSEINP